MVRKKIFFGIALLCLTGCLLTSRAEALRAEPEQSIDDKDKLLYGYNVTNGKNLFEPDSLQTTYSIIDESSDYLDHVKKVLGHTQSTVSYSGSSVRSALSNYSTSIGASVFGKVYMVNLDIDSTFDMSKTVNNVYSEYFELYSTVVTKYYYVVQLTTNEIKDYLSERFRNAIEGIKNINDAKNVFATYGTHLNTGYTFGGRLDISNYKTTSNSSIDFSTKLALSEKIGATIGAVTAGQSASISQDYAEQENTSETTSTYRFKSYGGRSMNGITIDQLFTFSESLWGSGSSGFGYTEWLRALDDQESLAIVGIPNGAQSIPLWNLLPSTSENVSRRQYLMDAYREICGDRYDEFCRKYKELARTNSSLNPDSTDACVVNNIYIRTKNDYFYEVDPEDFVSGGKHGEIHTGDVIYFDMDNYSSIESTYFDENNSSGVEILDDRYKNIFKVTGTSGNAAIALKYGSTGNTKQEICALPIRSCLFEGGTGDTSYPYLIDSEEQFKNITSKSDKSFILLRDLDFTDVDYSPMASFSGTLNGNYCSIKNLKINDNSNWGLFSENRGTINNLTLKNVGTSTNHDDFVAGGADFGNQFSDPNFNKNSIAAYNAGIIAGKNSGRIENVYVTGAFIRNVVNKAYNNEFKQHIGGLVGENSGVIENVMVRDINILNSNIDTSGAATIELVTAGLVGVANGGSISGAVVIMDSSNRLYTLMNNGDSTDNKTSVILIDSELVGLVSKKTDISNTYCYYSSVSQFGLNIKAANKIINSAYILKSSTVFFQDSTIAGQCNLEKIYAHYADGDAILFKANYIDTTKTATGLNGKATEISNEAFDQLDVRDNANFSYIDLDSKYFVFDNSKAGKIAHTFDKDKNNIVSASAKSGIKSNYYSGELFVPFGIEVHLHFQEGDEIAPVFKVEATEADHDLDTVLDNIGNNNYHYDVYLYGDTQNRVKAKAISAAVLENEISRIFVDSNEEQIIDFDDRDDYVSNFDFNSVPLKAVLTNGQIVTLDETSPYSLSNGKLYITNPSPARINPGSGILEGDNLISIKYANSSKSYETKFVLTCVKKDIESISVTKDPEVTNYVDGETFNHRGMEITVTYEGGKQKVFSGNDLSKFEFTGELLSYGLNNIYITLDDYNVYAVYSVQVGQSSGGSNVLSELSITRPSKVSFYVNDEFTYDGLRVYATYEDSSVRELNPSEYQVIAPDMSTPGVKQVVVRHEYLTAYYEIVVRQEGTIIEETSISATCNKDEYKVGDTINNDDFNVRVNYSDGTYSTLDSTEFTITIPDMSSMGNKKVVITYKDLTTTVSIKVVDQSGEVNPDPTDPDNPNPTPDTKKLVGIQVLEKGAKLNFKVKEAFSYNGLLVMAKYSDGSQEVIPLSECIINEPDLTTKGERTVYVEYKGFVDFYVITVEQKSGGCFGFVGSTMSLVLACSMFAIGLVTVNRIKRKDD